MIVKEHNPNINSPIMVFGINFFELALITGGFIVFMLVLGIINAFSQLFGPLTFLIGLFIYLILVLILRFANKQGERDYLISFISFHLFQPKKIKILNPNGTGLTNRND